MLNWIYISCYLVILALGLFYTSFKNKKYAKDIRFLLTFVFYYVLNGAWYILINLIPLITTNEQFIETFWSLNLFLFIISTLWWSSVYIIELHKKWKYKYIPLLFFFFLLGNIISQFLNPNNYEMQSYDTNVIFIFNNSILILFIIILELAVIMTTIISQLKGSKNYNDKGLIFFYNVFIFLFSIEIIIFLAYIITAINFLKHLLLIITLVKVSYGISAINLKPSLFLVFTNKLYNLIIFHKSGILLFSYNFETKEEIDDSLLKGSILIGINHILANFSNIKNKINLIKLTDKGIIFYFNESLGFATLLIVKHRNQVLEDIIEKFNNNFIKNFSSILKNLNGFIDSSQFKETKDLIQKYFYPYLVSS